MSLEMPKVIQRYGILVSGKFQIPNEISHLFTGTAFVSEEGDRIIVSLIPMYYRWRKKEFFEMPIDAGGYITIPSAVVVRQWWVNRGFDMEVEASWCVLTPTTRGPNLILTEDHCKECPISEAEEMATKGMPVILDGDRKEAILGVRER